MVVIGRMLSIGWRTCYGVKDTPAPVYKGNKSDLRAATRPPPRDLQHHRCEAQYLTLNLYLKPKTQQKPQICGDRMEARLAVLWLLISVRTDRQDTRSCLTERRKTITSNAAKLCLGLFKQLLFVSTEQQCRRATLDKTSTPRDPEK